MSDTLSNLAATTLGAAPAIGPQPAAFFAPQARPPAAPLPDAVARLRASPIIPDAAPAGLPAPPRLVRDPALIDRPAPSLRRLVQATAVAGGLITPLPHWSPPLVEDPDPGAAFTTAEDAMPGVTREPGSMAGQAGPRATEMASPARQAIQPPATDGPPADQPFRSEPASSQRAAEERRPAELIGSIQTDPAPASTAPAELTAMEAAIVDRSPSLVQPAAPAQPDSLEIALASTEAPADRTAPAEATRRKTLGTQPGEVIPESPIRATPAGSTGPDSTGTALGPAGSTPPDPLAGDQPPGIATGQAKSSVPARANQGLVNRGRQDPAGAPLKPAATAPLETGRPGVRVDNVQPSEEIRAGAAGPDSRDPLPVVSGPAPAPRPLQAASKQGRPLPDHGQVSVVYGQALAEHGQAPAEHGQAPIDHDQVSDEQGQALARHGRASAGQESDRPPRGSLRPPVNLEPARVAAPGTEGFGHIPPGPGQSVLIDMADGRQYPAEGTVVAGRSLPVTQPAGASQIRPTLEPEFSDAGPTLQSLPLSEQPGRPQPPAGDKMDQADSAGIRPDVGSPIRPVLQPLPGTADRPVSPAPPPRPTIEITIGRVEVRLRPEAARPPQPAPRPKPALSLDDYLSRQGRGR